VPAVESTREIKNRRAVATAAVAVWLITLALLWGPARWELAHTYAHWIEGTDGNLPALTPAVALPVLGLGEPGMRAVAVRLLFWGFLWLGPVVILILVWRARTREELVEVLLLSVLTYGALVVFLSALLALGLWLPFSLL
jgi:hypothetical protein